MSEQSSGVSNVWEGEPALYFFGGYKPRYYHHGDGMNFEDDTSWPMDSFYLLAIFGVFGLSMLFIVRLLGRELSSADRVERVSVKKNSKTFAIVEQVLGGYDFMILKRNASNRERSRISTEITEALADSNRADRAKLAVSAAARKDLLLRRTIGISISVLLLLGGFAGITAAMYEDTRRDLETNVHVLLPTLIIQAVTSGLPGLIKKVVAYERWGDPETVLIMTTGRNFMIKMLSLIVVWFNLQINTTDNLDVPDACHETKAGVTFFRLLLTDMLTNLTILLVVRPIMMRIPASTTFPLSYIPFGKKATFELPDEMMKLVYRQALMWVGSMFMPVMFIWGTFQASALYFATYASLFYCHKPPDKPFGAARAKETALWLLFGALLVSIVPFSLFLSANTNIKCGPLRHHTCAPLNTTCGADTLPYECTTQRTNIDGMESLFPDVHKTSNGTSSLVTSLQAFDDCDGNNVRCWVQVALTAIFSTGTLAVCVLALALLQYFTRARLTRVTTQLRATSKALEEEHHDKILLIRNLGIAMD